MRKIAADWIFTGHELLQSMTLSLDDEGKIIALEDGIVADSEFMKGLVSVPFVNAHCHLELSHLKGQLPEKTGMAGFVMALQPIRDKFSDEEKLKSMEAALQEMRAGGIAAIGDICNGTASLPVKKAHPEFQFHNFIELFGLDPSQGENFFFKGLELLREFGRNTSITPHAPYSVSKALRDKVLQYAERRAWPLSIHLLESEEERRLFEELEGPLMDFILGIGAVFQAHTYDSALDYMLEDLPQNCPTLLVHCTEMNAAELEKTMQDQPNTSIVLCPLANQYIHGKLPDARMFEAYPERICLGTDSLAGNHCLSIVAEMEALQCEFEISAALLLRWASYNGAKAIGFDSKYFEIAVGNRPGLIHFPAFRPEQIAAGKIEFIQS